MHIRVSGAWHVEVYKESLSLFESDSRTRDRRALCQNWPVDSHAVSIQYRRHLGMIVDRSSGSKSKLIAWRSYSSVTPDLAVCWPEIWPPRPTGRLTFSQVSCSLNG